MYAKFELNRQPGSGSNWICNIWRQTSGTGETILPYCPLHAFTSGRFVYLSAKTANTLNCSHKCQTDLKGMHINLLYHLIASHAVKRMFTSCVYGYTTSCQQNLKNFLLICMWQSGHYRIVFIVLMNILTMELTTTDYFI